MNEHMHGHRLVTESMFSVCGWFPCISLPSWRVNSNADLMGVWSRFCPVQQHLAHSLPCVDTTIQTCRREETALNLEFRLYSTQGSFPRGPADSDPHPGVREPQPLHDVCLAH